MPESGRNKTWKQEQKKLFGDRLKWAQKRAGFTRSSDVIRKLEALQHKTGLAPKTYYSHAGGERVPDDDKVIGVYSDLFKISRDFLLFGFGPELEEFTEFLNSGSQGLINPENTAERVNASQFQPVRYIPILRATSIKQFLTGTGDAAIMASEFLPVARDIVAGPRTYAYPLPRNDRSMVGAGPISFHPETILSVDADRPIMPGDFALVWPEGWPEPTLRQLRAKRPLMPNELRYPFELTALNDEFEAIAVESEEDCVILGRLIAASQKF